MNYNPLPNIPAPQNGIIHDVIEYYKDKKKEIFNAKRKNESDLRESIKERDRTIENLLFEIESEKTKVISVEDGNKVLDVELKKIKTERDEERRLVENFREEVELQNERYKDIEAKKATQNVNQNDFVRQMRSEVVNLRSEIEGKKNTIVDLKTNQHREMEETKTEAKTAVVRMIESHNQEIKMNENFENEVSKLKEEIGSLKNTNKALVVERGVLIRRLGTTDEQETTETQVMVVDLGNPAPGTSGANIPAQPKIATIEVTDVTDEDDSPPKRRKTARKTKTGNAAGPKKRTTRSRRQPAAVKKNKWGLDPYDPYYYPDDDDDE